MAFFTLEDLSGSCEVVVFPELYKSSQSIVQSEETIFVKGRVNMRDDEPKVIANELISLADVQKKLPRMISIHLTMTGLTTETLAKLKEILNNHKGNIPLYLAFRNAKGAAVVVSPSESYRVETSDDLFHEIEELLGENSVKIRT